MEGQNSIRCQCALRSMGLQTAPILPIKQRTLEMDVKTKESHDDILLRPTRRELYATLSVTQYRTLWGT